MSLAGEQREYWLLFCRWEVCWGTNYAGNPDMTETNKVVYCVNLGDIPDEVAEIIATQNRVTYADRPRKWRSLSVHPDDDPYDVHESKDHYGDYYEMRPSISLSEEQYIECQTAIVRYRRAKKTNDPHGAIDLMETIRQAVKPYRKTQELPPKKTITEESFDFSNLTPDKGRWVPVAEFAKLKNTSTKTLENRRGKRLGGISNKDRTRGIDSESNRWKKTWMTLKNGQKSNKKKICYYWVPNGDSAVSVKSDGCAADSSQETNPTMPSEDRE